MHLSVVDILAWMKSIFVWVCWPRYRHGSSLRAPKGSLWTLCTLYLGIMPWYGAFISLISAFFFTWRLGLFVSLYVTIIIVASYTVRKSVTQGTYDDRNIIAPGHSAIYFIPLFISSPWGVLPKCSAPSEINCDRRTISALTGITQSHATFQLISWFPFFLKKCG